MGWGFHQLKWGGRFTTLVPSPLFNLIRFETLHPPLQKKSKNGDDFEAILRGEQCRIQDFLLKWANWYHTYKRISDWTKGKFGDPSIHPMTGEWNCHIYLHEWFVFVNVRKYPTHGSYGYYIAFSRIWIVRHTISPSQDPQISDCSLMPTAPKPALHWRRVDRKVYGTEPMFWVHQNPDEQHLICGTWPYLVPG